MCKIHALEQANKIPLMCFWLQNAQRRWWVQRLANRSWNLLQQGQKVPGLDQRRGSSQVHLYANGRQLSRGLQKAGYGTFAFYFMTFVYIRLPMTYNTLISAQDRYDSVRGCNINNIANGVVIVILTFSRLVDGFVIFFYHENMNLL